jgi:hypothetical protein
MKLTTCGNSCDVCRAFKENHEKLDEREALSAAWKKYLDLELSPLDIHCPGGPCCAVGLGLVHEGCHYKECTAAHGVEHCGQCPDYPCARFGEGRKMSENDMRENLGVRFELEEYEKYVKAFDHKTWVDEYRKSQKKKRKE